MKKTFLVVIIFFLLFSLTAHSQENNYSKDYNFVKFNWGAKYKKILSKEENNLISKHDDRLFYKTKIKEYDCELAYIFKDNELINILYVIDNSKENSKKLYNSLKNILKTKYGMYLDPDEDKLPAIVKSVWPQTLIWEDNKTVVLLTTMSKINEIQLYFFPKNLKEYFKQIGRKNNE